MPTKTERILEHLPRSFQAAVGRSALRAVAGAVGGELQRGEIALARIMRAHWVDSADEDAPKIDDLARLGSMWGLAPLRDSDGTQLESVEQFREHLKRHVRTLLEGRVTVRGLLRVAAETLGVHIADDAIDAWWLRPDPWLVTSEPEGRDAATLVFGVPAMEDRGADAQPATIRGRVTLTAGADLSAGSILKLQVDGGGARVIDLAAGQPEPSSVPLSAIVDAINAELPSVAAAEEGRLVLRSPTTGPSSRLELEDVDGDASLAVLGIPPRIYTGREPRPATLQSAFDLSGGVDLERDRFVRLTLDGTRTIEVDCADPANPGSTLLDRIRDAVNEALGEEVARHDNRFLTLQSPREGSGGSVFLREPAAQDGAARIFGDGPRFAIGSDARPAVVTSQRDLSQGVDLRTRSLVRLGVDGAHPVAVNCAGADPEKTTVEEIVTALNAAFGPGFARTDGRRLTLTTHTAGRTGELIFGNADEADALDDVFGFGPRVFTGTAAVPASLTSRVDLSGGADLLGARALGLIVDDQPMRVIELPLPELRRPEPPETAESIRRTDLQAIVDAIDAAVGQDIASRTDTALVLTSTVVGAASRLAVVPLAQTRRRRFVTRAAVLDDAAVALFGFVAREARGGDATQARLSSTRDLRFGVDLREQRWLRIAVDGRPGVEFACAGPRPQATTIDDLIAAITEALPELQVFRTPTALTIQSRTAGAGSRIVFEPVRATDALPTVLGREPGEVRGEDAGTVAFVGTADLSQGVELPAGAAVRIGVDAVAPVEVVLNHSTEPVRLLPRDIVDAVNAALAGAFAGHDGRVVTLTSRERGEASFLRFDVPDGVDVTRAVFGIAAPRVYQAREARAARIAGGVDLGESLSLGPRRFLRVAVDGGAAHVIDLTTAAANPDAPTPDEIRTAINATVNGIATLEGSRLVLTSRVKGSASRLRLEAHVAGDARDAVFGDAPDEVHGSDATPAEITGDIAHTGPLDLTATPLLRISVDGERSVEVDVGGVTPAQVTLDDVIDAINGVLHGVVSRTPDRQLRLRAPSRGTGSRIAVEARRHLELVEYPSVPAHIETGPIGHGDGFVVDNTGVEVATARITLTSLHGTVEPGLINHRAGRRVTLALSLRAGDVAVFDDLDGELVVTLHGADGTVRVLDADEIRLESIVADPQEGVLALGRGATPWTFSECVGPRFDTSRYDEERYPASPGQTVGMFDVSRFDGALEHDQSIFAPRPLPPPSAHVRVDWSQHQGGAFELRLPAELPTVFGGRFNEARFGIGVEEREVEIEEVDGPPTKTTALVNRRAAFPGVVFAPESDQLHVARTMDPDHPLVEVATVRTNVPLGFVAQQAPFRAPRHLALGELDGRARLFLTEAGSDELVELIAPEAGASGTRLFVSARPDGPGRYLLEIGFDADRFECGRALVLGPPEGAATRAAPGILQAKAAGVRARVTRAGTYPHD